MISFAIPIVFFFVLSSGIALWVKKQVGYIVPFALMGSTLVLYLSGVAYSAFLPGLIFVVAAAIGMLAVQVIRGIQNGTLWECVKTYVITPGAASYILFAGLCSVLAWLHGSDLVYWDEFAHWGQMTKELYRLGTFYTVQGTTLLYHNDYPPIIPLWEALNCMLAGRFIGKFMYASLWLLQCSLFLPVIEAAGKRSSSTAFALISLACALLFTLVCVPCFDAGRASFWLSIYPDTVMALIAGLGFYLVAVWSPQQRSVFTLATMATLVAFLILVKQAALFFVMLMLLVVLGKVTVELFCDSRPKSGSGHSNAQRNARLQGSKHAFPCMLSDSVRYIGLTCAVLLAAIAFAYVSWRMVVAGSPVPSAHGQFSIHVSDAFAFVNVLLGGGSSYQQQVVATFFDALANRPSSCDYASFITYPVLCGISFAVVLFCCALSRTHRSSGLCLLALQVVSAVLYAFFMLLMYLYSFSQSDALSLVCFERYMNVCATANAFSAFAFFLVVFADETGKGKQWTLTGLAVALLVMLCCLFLCPSLMQQFQVAKDPNLSTLKKDARFLVSHVPHEERVFIVNQGHPAFETLQIAYYTDGVTVSRDVESAGFDAAENKWIASADELSNYLSDENYLYVRSVDQDFLDRYGDLFNMTLEEGRLYRVSSASGEAVFLEAAN